MKCKFCNREQVYYCNICKAPLCKEHAKKGRNNIIYCPTCNANFYKAVSAFTEKIRSYCNQEGISGKHIYEVKARLHYYIDRDVK